METVVVQTKQGKIKGLKEHHINIWKGIPFAEPPVGNLRIEPPHPLSNWEGIREALTFGPICPQNVEPGVISGNADQTIQSEDCLYLNIWAPEDLDKPHPVMVWIHGGAFRSGSGSLPIYNGSSFVKQGDVVVVSLNYRLGPFGFLQLSSLNNQYSANLGLLDQIAALKWVQENIEAFGGDPNQVTIFGESAGSMSIAALLSMPQAKGLFQKAIMESGASSTIAPELARAVAEDFIQELGGTDLSILKTVSTQGFLEAANRTENKFRFAGMVFQPTVDEKTLPVEPIKAIAQGRAAGIPLIIGTNRDEGSLFFRPDMESLPEEMLIQSLATYVGREKAKYIMQMYPHNVDGHAQIMTDFVFWLPALLFAEHQSRYAPVWMYRFDWCLPDHPKLSRAMHAIEIPFVFNNPHFLQVLQVTVDESISGLAHEIHGAWLSFAKSGVPKLTSVEWPAYSSDERATLIFGNEPQLTFDPESVKREQIMAGAR